MAPKPKQKPRQESDDEDLLRAVMSKYKDRAKEKDEDAVKAAEDWDKFQNISALESQRLGGSESTTHLVKGLDVELLRHQREQLMAQQVPDHLPAHHPETVGDQRESALGRAIEAILFNPDKPHPHNVHFKEQLLAMERGISKLLPNEEMPGSTSFFRHSRYAFRQDLEQPIVLMKSREEIDEEPPRGAHVRYDASIIAAVAEALKRKKSKKQKSETIVSKTVTASDEDFDMFAGFAGPSVALPVPSEASGPYFAEQTDTLMSHTNDLEKLQDNLLTRRTLQEPKRPREEEEEDIIFQQKSSFGEKLDLSKFATVDAEETKRKKVSDKQLFNQVMKRVNDRDKS